MPVASNLEKGKGLVAQLLTQMKPSPYAQFRQDFYGGVLRGEQGDPRPGSSGRASSRGPCHLLMRDRRRAAQRSATGTAASSP